MLSSFPHTPDLQKEDRLRSATIVVFMSNHNRNIHEAFANMQQDCKKLSINPHCFFSIGAGGGSFILICVGVVCFFVRLRQSRPVRPTSQTSPTDTKRCDTQNAAHTCWSNQRPQQLPRGSVYGFSDPKEGHDQTTPSAPPLPSPHPKIVRPDFEDL